MHPSHSKSLALRKLVGTVWPLFIGRALVGPKRWDTSLTLSIYRVRIIDPFCNRDIRRSGIRVLNIKEGHRGKLVINRDRNRLGQISRFADYGQLLPGSHAVTDALALP